jgi:hypothetical protein
MDFVCRFLRNLARQFYYRPVQIVIPGEEFQDRERRKIEVS